MANLVEYPIRHIPTKKWGLENEFTIYPTYDDNSDWTGLCNNCSPTIATQAFSEWNREELKKLVQPWMRSIVEIGVSRDGWEASSTKILLDNKDPHCFYTGFDIEDRSWVTEKSTNVRFKQNSSWDIIPNMQTILDTGYPWIDLLFIDGDHSVNAVLKEWDYAKLVRPNGGIVVLHDTNFHPGPWCLMRSYDKTLFTAELFCESNNDWGLGVLRRL